MRKYITAILIGILFSAPAWAQFAQGSFGDTFGWSHVSIAPTGHVLLENGTDSLLLEDNTSLLCFEAGC
jgi:hypothetical protein